MNDIVTSYVNPDLDGTACMMPIASFWEKLEEIATLLYYGIVSNTINFKAKVTTQRDLEMAKGKV